MRSLQIANLERVHISSNQPVEHVYIIWYHVNVVVYKVYRASIFK